MQIRLCYLKNNNNNNNKKIKLLSRKILLHYLNKIKNKIKKNKINIYQN